MIERYGKWKSRWPFDIHHLTAVDPGLNFSGWEVCNVQKLATKLVKHVMIKGPFGRTPATKLPGTTSAATLSSIIIAIIDIILEVRTLYLLPP